jgi:hypothetical protein
VSAALGQSSHAAFVGGAFLVTIEPEQGDMDDGAFVKERGSGGASVMQPNRLAVTDCRKPFLTTLGGAEQELPGLGFVRAGLGGILQEGIQDVTADQLAVEPLVGGNRGSH